VHQPALASGTPNCHTLQYQRFRRFTALHRLQLNNHSPAWLPHPLISSDGRRPRLCCSTLVSLRICTARVLCTTDCGENHCNQPPPTAAMHATFGCLVWPATRRSTADRRPRALVRTVLLRIPGRLLPQVLLTPRQFWPSTCLNRTPSDACNRNEAPC
jgi:hypothetical protein